MKPNDHMLDLSYPRIVEGVEMPKDTLMVSHLPTDPQAYYGPYNSVAQALVEGRAHLDSLDALPLLYVKCRHLEDTSVETLSKLGTFRAVSAPHMSLAGVVGAFIDESQPSVLLALVMTNAMAPIGSPHASAEERTQVFLLRRESASLSLVQKVADATYAVAADLWPRRT